MKIFKKTVMAVIIVLVVFTVIFLIISYTDNKKYTELLAYEISELQSYNGITDITQVQFILRDADGLDEADALQSSEIHNFIVNGCFRYVTDQEGIKLGYVVKKNDIYYEIIYNPSNNKYTIEEYMDYTREVSGCINTDNEAVRYLGFYLVSSKGNRQLLFSVKSSYSDYIGINDFVKWTKETKEWNNIEEIDIMEGVSSRKISDDIVQFYREVTYDSAWAGCGYRYIHQDNGKTAVCYICYQHDSFVHITYIPSEERYDFREYTNIYRNYEDGNISYILSNLDKEAVCEKNSVFDESIKDYIYILPVIN